MRASARDPRPDPGLSAAVERWLVVLVLLALTTIGAVGGIGLLTARQLDRSDDGQTAGQAVLLAYQQAEVDRSTMESAMVQAAAGMGNPASKAAATATAVGAHDLSVQLDRTRQLLVAARAEPTLLVAFDRLSDASIAYSNAVLGVANLASTGASAEVTARLPALVGSAKTLDAELQPFVAAITARAEAGSRAVTRAGQRGRLELLLCTAAGVSLVAVVALLIYRRQRSLLAAKLVAEGAAAEANEQLRAQVARQDFASRLNDALQMADTDEDVFAVTRNAVDDLAPELGAELLLADDSYAHLRPAFSRFPDERGCAVNSPSRCPAIRRGQARIFAVSTALDSCPRLRGEQPCSAVCVPLKLDGHGVGVLHLRAEAGRPPFAPDAEPLVTVANQVASRLATLWAYERAQLQAATDGLTGMLNRRSVEDRIGGLIARSSSFVVAMIDLDHFKTINDTLGHESGDRALRAFTRVVHDNIRTGDLAARQGGDEFLIVFPGASMAAASDIIERIREATVSVAAAAELPPFTASYGLAQWRTGMTLTDVLARADTRLMRAKHLGRDRVVTSESPAEEPVAS